MDNQGTIKNQAFYTRETGWVTPEMPRGFFMTTKRVDYSPDEDFFEEEEGDEDGDDVTIMWEGAHQHNDEDDDDDDEPITVLKPEYKHELTTFGQHVPTDNNDAIDHDDAEDDDYDDVPPLEQFKMKLLRHHHNIGLAPRPPAAPQNRAQRAPAALRNIAPNAPVETSATVQLTRVPRSEVNSRYKSSSLRVPRKRKFAREESQVDVKKILEFFEKMKKTNPEFFMITMWMSIIV
ncbi:hypothetical protein D1007_09618 [Hordeum vulgare]|nr:hypothetical protein D1007_09618 [Hordeum vulgare]